MELLALPQVPGEQQQHREDLEPPEHHRDDRDPLRGRRHVHETAGDDAEAGADALIVQDLGVARIARECGLYAVQVHGDEEAASRAAMVRGPNARAAFFMRMKLLPAMAQKMRNRR